MILLKRELHDFQNDVILAFSNPFKNYSIHKEAFDKRLSIYRVFFLKRVNFTAVIRKFSRNTSIDVV